MPAVLLVESSLIPASRVLDYRFLDSKDNSHSLKRIQDEGQTAILNSRIYTGVPAGTKQMAISDIIALCPTSLCVENPGAISLEELSEFLNNTTTLVAFNLDSYFHHNTKDRFQQLTNLVTIALEKNPNLQHISLTWCPLSDLLFDILISVAEAGRLKSFELSDHNNADAKFARKKLQLQQAIESAQKMHHMQQPPADVLAASLMKGLGNLPVVGNVHDDEEKQAPAALSSEVDQQLKRLGFE